MFLFKLVSPVVTLMDPGPVVRALPSFRFSCLANGQPPIYTALIRNTTVLVNTTGTASIQLYEEGNYSCVATSINGKDKKEFSVVFTGKTLILSSSYITYYENCLLMIIIQSFSIQSFQSMIRCYDT